MGNSVETQRKESHTSFISGRCGRDNTANTAALGTACSGRAAAGDQSIWEARSQLCRCWTCPNQCQCNNLSQMLLSASGGCIGCWPQHMHIPPHAAAQAGLPYDPLRHLTRFQRTSLLIAGHNAMQTGRDPVFAQHCFQTIALLCNARNLATPCRHCRRSTLAAAHGVGRHHRPQKRPRSCCDTVLSSEQRQACRCEHLAALPTAPPGPSSAAVASAGSASDRDAASQQEQGGWRAACRAPPVSGAR